MPPIPTTSNGQAISRFLADTWLGPRQVHKQLALWPLLLRDGVADDAGPLYRPLAEAAERGELAVDEVSEAGSVPHVRVSNRGDAAVLFLFGEEIRGAKQNRIANASFLVPPKTTLTLDVSCVESGRWGRRDRADFAASQEVVSSGLRRKMASKVADSLSHGRGFDADQSEVWKGVSQRLRFAGAHSRTEAYADYRGSRRHDVEELRRAFRPLERQVGFVASIGDEVVGLEAIGRPEVFARAFPALLDSYAIDAVDAALLEQTKPAQRRGAARFGSPEGFLDALTATPFTESDSLGLGQDLRSEGGSITACALVHGPVVHLTAFPAESQPEPPRRLRAWSRRS